MIKKLILIGVGCLISLGSYASILDCIDASLDKNFKETIKICPQYSQTNPSIQGAIGASYGHEKKYHLAEKYLLAYIQYEESLDEAERSHRALPSAYAELGNMYYFKQIPGGRKKGLYYIMKAARLGANIAQAQLSAFYGRDDEGFTKNFPTSYMWAVLAMINGNKNVEKTNYIYSHRAGAKRKFPYCIALGQRQVSQMYQIGSGGLKKSYSDALYWLKKAYTLDSHLAIVNLDYSHLLYLTADDDASFKMASKAVSEPYPPAMQHLGIYYLKGIGTDKNQAQAYLYLKLAEYYYQHPAHQYWLKYGAPCRPVYQQTSDTSGLKEVQQYLAQIHLSSAEMKKIAAKMAKIKASFEFDK